MYCCGLFPPFLFPLSVASAVSFNFDWQPHHPTQDGKVLLWTQPKSSEAWDGPVALPDFNTTVWRVSWSITGNVLAVSAADNKVTLWKQALDSTWQNVGEVNEPVS